MREPMKAGQLLVSSLGNERVRFVFGLPGEENLELMDALRDSGIRFVLTRHEGAAAFMAVSRATRASVSRHWVPERRTW